MPSLIPIMAYGLLVSYKKQWKYQKNPHLGFCFSFHYGNRQSAIKKQYKTKGIRMCELIYGNFTSKPDNESSK